VAPLSARRCMASEFGSSNSFTVCLFPPQTQKREEAHRRRRRRQAKPTRSIFTRRRGGVDPEAPPAPLLQKQLTRRARGSAVGRSVYKWRRERRAAAALREGGKEEKRRRPLLPTGTALGIAPSPPRRRRPQQMTEASIDQAPCRG